MEPAPAAAAPLNPFTGYTAQTGHTVTYSDDNNRRCYQTGLYLQDEMVWDRWHVDVSARYDRIVSQQVKRYLRHLQTAVQTTISAAAPRCCTPLTTVSRPDATAGRLPQRCCRARTANR